MNTAREILGMIATEACEHNYPKEAVVSCGVLGEFERRALWTAHFNESNKLFRKASDLRAAAAPRGLLWQRYLKAAIKHERRARELA